MKTAGAILDLIGDAVRDVDRAISNLVEADVERGALRPALEARIRELELARKRLVELREKARAEVGS